MGAKYSFLNERLMMEGAVFRTEKDNARETDSANSNNIVVAGNQAVKGAQYSIVGRLPQGMDLVAGYAYLDSKVIASKFYPNSVGYPLANVPKQTFNVFLTHRLPLRFNGGLGGNYVASRTASSTTPFVPLTFSPGQKFAAGTAPCGGDRHDLLRGGVCGDETGAGVLGVQRDAAAADDGSSGGTGEREQSAEPILHRCAAPEPPYSRGRGECADWAELQILGGDPGQGVCKLIVRTRLPMIHFRTQGTGADSRHGFVVLG